MCTKNKSSQTNDKKPISLGTTLTAEMNRLEPDGLRICNAQDFCLRKLDTEHGLLILGWSNEVGNI